MLKLLEKLGTSLGLRIGKKPKTNPTNNQTFGDTTLINPKVQMIEGTPFATVEKEENKIVVIFGQHMITNQTFYSRGAAEKWAKSPLDALTILNIVGIYVEEALKNNNIKNKN